MGKLKSSCYLITVILLFCQLLISIDTYAQISPGDLSEAHSHLEGMSHCTDCHTLGEKVSNDKCLNCHTLLKERVINSLGFHSSKEISGKECIVCHSDHHGRKFEMIRFDKDKFDHKLTGYNLSGAHAKLDCSKCHRKEFISNMEISNKNYTFLGLNTDCISCHNDYHKKTLPFECIKCHDFNAFKPAMGFDHNNTKFILKGKHADVECVKCHKVSTINGSKFQEFSGVEFASCTNCHKDPHDNKFGQNCTQCHNEQSFVVVGTLNNFDHNRTNFKLVDKHVNLDCKKCHKNKLTDPVRHANCFDCHEDYHRGELITQTYKPDCNECHTTKGFIGSLYTIEKHNNSEFKLEGAHMATPCFVCHKKKERWEFGNMGTKCYQCHEDIHKGKINSKYYPNQSCESCHNPNYWAMVSFDHNSTEYKLEGKHRDVGCRQCHFKPTTDGNFVQRFTNLKDNCAECHKDQHYKQFESNGVTDCFTCHDYNNWKANKFDHNKSRFVLDGKHQNVPCASCHKPKQLGNETYVLYKLNEFKCEDCH